MTTLYVSHERGASMLRSLSQPSLLHDAPLEVSPYMTVRRSGKMYRVPVKMIADPSPGVNIVHSNADVTVGRRVRSREGARNWTMKSNAAARAEDAQKRSLQLRNNAVSELFVPQPQITPPPATNTLQPRRYTKAEAKRVTAKHATPEFEKIKQYSTVTNRRADGSATALVGFPIGATLPRSRVRSEGIHNLRHAHARPQLPQEDWYTLQREEFHRPPSPSSTIRDFDFDEFDAPLSPRHFAHVLYSHDAHDVTGPIQTSTPPGSTRMYAKRGQSANEAWTENRAMTSTRARGRLSDDVFVSPEVQRRRTSSRERPVYSGEVVTVKVTSGKQTIARRDVTASQSSIPDHYQTYPRKERRLRNSSDDVFDDVDNNIDRQVRSATSSSSGNRSATVAMDAGATSRRDDVTSDGGSPGRSVSTSSTADEPDDVIYTVAFSENF